MTGRIEVITGPMFSGKTEELIRRLRRAEIAKQKIAVFKPALDDRYSTDDIMTHTGKSMTVIPLHSAADLDCAAVRDAEVIGIDEVQFFEDNPCHIIDAMANDGKRAIIAGLDTDYRGAPFCWVTPLMSIADSVTKLSAVCVACGADAIRSYRLNNDVNQISVGGADLYEARCRQCFNYKRSKDNE